MTKIKAHILKDGIVSKKESVVLCYLCEGYMRKEIALRVCRTPSTVNRHIENIAKKLDCSSAAEIVATAIAIKMVRIEINHDHSLFSKCLMVLLMFNFTAGHLDFQRSPRSPRPLRTMRVSGRLVRGQRQFP